MSDYYETFILRDRLDEQGIFWTDVKIVGRMRTVFKADPDSDVTWYVDEVKESGVLQAYSIGWAEKVLMAIGLEE